ncbi:MAG: hypothetical protein ABSC64_22170, partial [Candidatus Korobacteraceae bacterium]
NATHFAESKNGDTVHSSSFGHAFTSCLVGIPVSRSVLNCKLPDQGRELRAMRAEGDSYNEIAEALGRSKADISGVRDAGLRTGPDRKPR